MVASRRSYSQVAEDLLAAFYLGKDRGVTYVNVGCLWPVEHSNTYFFYRRGGSGVCIDPNPMVKAAYEETRPRDCFVNCGVGSDAGMMTYFQFANPVFNTFSAPRAAALQTADLEKGARGGRELVAETLVAVRPLHDILLAADWRGRFGPTIDFLSIDVEGRELEGIS